MARYLFFNINLSLLVIENKNEISFLSLTYEIFWLLHSSASGL